MSNSMEVLCFFYWYDLVARSCRSCMRLVCKVTAFADSRFRKDRRFYSSLRKCGECAGEWRVLSVKMQ